MSHWVSMQPIYLLLLGPGAFSNCPPKSKAENNCTFVQLVQCLHTKYDEKHATLENKVGQDVLNNFNFLISLS